MKELLVINCSPRQARSHSRTILEKFISQWSPLNPDVTIDRLDLSSSSVPLVDESWIIGAFTPPENHSPEAKAALAVSDKFIDQFLSADAFAIAVPMYNLNIPAVFKAYIDQIVRVGRTFGVGPNGYFGLATGKKALFFTASGGSFREGTPFAPYNFQEPYLRAIFGFMGITDVDFVVVDSQNAGEEAAASARVEADEKVSKLAKTW